MGKTPRAAHANWVIHIKQELADKPGCESNALMHVKPSITRVPAPLHVVRPSAFTPQTVAIGPFHRNLVRKGLYAFSFAEMEEYKVEAAKILSAQSSCDAAGAGLLEKLVQQIAIEEKEVRACFGKEMGLAALGSEVLGHMLALDCIFIVAFLHSFYNQLHARDAEDDKIWWVRSSFSRVYEGRFPYSLKKAVLLDLLLLENQVPLFLVKKAMQMMGGMFGEDVEASFQAMVDAVTDKTLPFCKGEKGVGGRKAKHLLDCLYKIVTHNDNMDEEGDDDKEGRMIKNDDEMTDPLLLQVGDGRGNMAQEGELRQVPTATKLHKSGVQFKGHNRSLSQVSFEEHTLTLPIIHVGDETECIFRNLLAYESQLVVDRMDVASYLHFMNSLINTPDDVALLVDAGVITENIGDYQHVARLWNKLATNTVCMFTPAYSHVAHLATGYVKEEIHSMMTELRERYFSRPWLVLSLLSAITLLSLNITMVWHTLSSS